MPKLYIHGIAPINHVSRFRAPVLSPETRFIHKGGMEEADQGEMPAN